MTVAAPSFLRLLLIVVLAISAAGCELIGGIFKAGIWVGAIAVIVVAVGVFWIVAKARG